MDFKRFMSTDAGGGRCVGRSGTGSMLIGHGLPKFGWVGDGGLAGTAGFLESIGVPLPMAGAFLVAFFEVFGGAFLILGLLTRFWGAGLAFAMLTAVTLVHLDAGMFGKGGYQWALLLMACSIAFAFEGAGKASLDKKLTS